MIKFEGLDKLQKELKHAQKALKELDGEIAQVSFDPNDPASINSAIVSMERMVDERVGQYAKNELVAPIIDEAKEVFKNAIIEKASQARLEADDE